MISRITPTTLERAQGALGEDTVAAGARSFRVDGALILDDIVDPSLILAARAAFARGYARYLDGVAPADALGVGDQRLMIGLDLEPPLGDPRMFANPWLLPLLGSALDEDFVVDSCGVVCSLPFAPAQHRHTDGAPLFPRSGIDPMLPASAITVIIPLLEMNELHGTTALWLGTHRGESRAPKEVPVVPVEPVVPEGSCVLWDYRLKHGGTPNRSPLPRPLLYLTYCRPWWIDHLNFSTQKRAPLRASRGFLAGLSERDQRLLARAETF